MKVVIFAGGKGTRISAPGTTIPKPMISIGGKPIIWHIMKIYASYGFNDFIICLGHKGEVIRKYFETLQSEFNVELANTGEDTMTGGRLKQIEHLLDGKDFMLTYGDGVANINIDELINFHQTHGKLCTLTTVQPTSRYGRVRFDENGNVLSFNEKPEDHETWINGGFFVLKNDVFKYLEGNQDHMMWERNPMEQIVKDNEMAAFQHYGFWQCMDTPRDKDLLDELWETNPEWKMW